MNSERGKRNQKDDGRNDAVSDPLSPVPGSEDKEDRLVAAVREYTDALEAGRRPNRRELLARYPDIAGDLSACLSSLAFVQSAAAQMPGNDAGDTGGKPLTAQPLGDFQLVREIGRGGMGVVYEAIQLSLGRRVAVKVLPLASALDSRQLQRFRNEAQAAAQLHHTNIVPVYAVGCERSVHFYAMQFIDGQSLAEVVAELRRIAGRGPAARDDSHGEPQTMTLPQTLEARGTSSLSPVLGGEGRGEGSKVKAGRLRASSSDPSPQPSPLSTEERGQEGSSISLRRPPSVDAATNSAGNLTSLRSASGKVYYRTVARLGLQVAEALDYAHRAGVVHRDIKPANLLLDVDGGLWVTDFGLAQFYADNNLTRTGDLLGTLRYMSPEQASGRAVVLDQRTDIYSLGVTLYELLTLERALPGETREQLLHQLGSYDPRPARSIDRAIPRELETILVKATAKEPADRYPSAHALAEDLRRYLHDEPILARPPSVWNKAVKWGVRHRALVASALVVLLLMAASLLVSTLFIAREQAKTHAAYVRETIRATEATQQRAIAERSFGQARDAVNFFSRVAANELANRPGSADVRKEMLEAALDYYQGFLEDHQSDTTVDADLKDARSNISKILSELSAFDDFERVQTSARLLSEASVQESLLLTAAQKPKARQVSADAIDDSVLADDFRGGPGGPGGSRGFAWLTSEQKQQKIARSAAKIQAALDAVLTTQQTERLLQITRQVRAPASFDDPDVARALGLSRAQKDAVRRIQAEYRIAMRKPHPRGGPQDDLDDNDWAPSPREDAVRKLLLHLSGDQVETWHRLRGEFFTGYLSFRYGPRGPGRDGPEHGDGPGFDGGPPPRDGEPPDGHRPNGPPPNGHRRPDGARSEAAPSKPGK